MRRMFHRRNDLIGRGMVAAETTGPMAPEDASPQCTEAPQKQYHQTSRNCKENINTISSMHHEHQLAGSIQDLGNPQSKARPSTDYRKVHI